MDFRIVLVTCKDRNEAHSIGKKLVEEHLAACVNIVPEAESIYRWKGKIEEGEEAVLFLKTVAENVPALIERVKKLHSYDCPCVVVLPIVGGNEEYLQWVGESCS